MNLLEEGVHILAGCLAAGPVADSVGEERAHLGDQILIIRQPLVVDAIAQVTAQL